MSALYNHQAASEDVTLIESVATQMMGKSLCALGDFATSPILSALKHWREEFVAYAKATTPAKPPAKEKVVAGRG